MQRMTWPEMAIGLAFAASHRSEDPYLKVGACILRPDMSVASTGYNGAPRGIDLDWSDRDYRRSFVLHAEVNAFSYTTRAHVMGGIIATTDMPCSECVKHIAAYGITRAYYARELDPEIYDAEHIRWVASVVGVDLNHIVIGA